MVLDLREVTTPANSGRATGVFTVRGWVTSVGLGPLGVGSAAPHAVASSIAGNHLVIGRVECVMGKLRVDRVLGGLDQAGVEAAGGDELIVVALLDDAAL